MHNSERIDTTPRQNLEEYQISLPEGVSSEYFKSEALRKLRDHEDFEDTLYEEPLDEHTDFRVDGLRKDGKVKIIARVATTITGEERYGAEFAFTDEPDENRLHLRHRLAHTKPYGVTGSEIEQKTEAILIQLFNNEVLTRRPLFLNAGQPTVINWALKNGFSFIHKREMERFENMQTHPENYQHNITITRTGDTFTRDNYVFEKEVAKSLNIPENGQVTADKLRDYLPHATRFSLSKEI